MNKGRLNNILFLIVLTVAASTTVSMAQVNTVDKQAGDWSNGDKAEQNFKKAHADFLKKDTKAAAEEIRKGAQIVKQEEGRAAIDAKNELSAADQELEKLASEVEKGRVASVKELDKVFARTHYALARNYYLKAAEAWTGKETAKTGHNLKSAAGGLEHGLAWAGQKVETGTKTAIRDAREAGNELTKGAGWAKDEVDKRMAALGKEIDTFGRKS